MNNVSLAGFIAWVRSAMQINTTILPDDSIWLTYAYEVAIALVNLELATVPSPIYMLAVYNLGGSNLINYAQDLPNAADVPGTDPPLPFFAAFRKSINANGFVSGVISSASDEGTSESMVVQKAAENFTLADLQLLKDPWGRTYLALAQKYGVIWGLN